MHNDTAIPLALECKQVTMKVRKKEILQEVTFSLEKGRIAGLLGPNGAGKSTLLSICSGLTEPTSGSVRIFGQPAGTETLRSIAVLPDRGKLPGWLTAGEWLHFAGQIYPDWDSDRESQLVQSLRIDLGTRISAQSRGEEARLQLVSCLARTSPLILLDEPFTGVDMISREQIASSVVADLADGNRTFLIATHDIREMEQLFDRIIMIGNGRIAADHDVDSLREQGNSVESRYREVFS
ncbi:ABC-2 type transport system ATP-binding protein [Paenibacillus sp. 1_12]|uniref:ABC transporter ATP-binding protein n=1 Tax=Paenibacillus sp. 1_12 TaxID=1566278 RepID=UPI0008E843E5|nr:ABC transporter ATP-binding protein [Paenibacillus sp. 1_12]SFL56580.1 ABC-2 type transport system ATP-binding protein [Paenibacillus sp. 1_12]